jgi:PAS domain S-box-containing protein
MANLSLEHGYCDASPLAFAQLSLAIGPRFGHYRDGFRFGRLGAALVEREDLARFRGKVYNVVSYHVLPWTEPIQAASSMMQRALDLTQESGDLLFVAYCQTHLISLGLGSGARLDELDVEAERYLQSTRKLRFSLFIDVITTQLALIRTLRGLAPKFGYLDYVLVDELRMEQHLSGNPMLVIAACWHWIRKMQARYLAGDYGEAVDASAKAQPLLRISPTHFETAEFYFYSALSYAAAWDSAPSDEKQQHFEALKAHHNQLDIWAQNCPENFENRATLISAQIARIEGRVLEAEHLYEQAIRSAHENGFVHNEAIANELAAHFYAARGFEKIAHAYLQDARYGYLRWGADGKVRQLDQLYPHLREKEPTSTIGAPVEHLDLATVIRVSQAVSGEIVLEKLIDTLMRTAIEHAGAERGLLTLPRGAEQRIEAEATTSGDTVIVRLRDVSAAGAALPESIVHYVVRTRESVILDDASVQNPFSADAYLRQHRARSVLCLPLINQARLIGVLYLENNLTPNVFNPTRIAVLELLASQAAISLENASLYSDLQRSEAFLAQGQTLSLTGSFGWSVLSGEIYWSEETYKIFEHDRVAKPTLEWIMQRIHPDDRGRVRQVIDRVSSEREDFDVEYRLLMTNGSIKHLHVVARALKTTAENLEFVGAVTDVTGAKQAEAELHHREAELLEAQRLSHTGSWKHDIASRRVIVSPEVYRIYGVRPDEVQPNTEFWLNRNHPEDAKRIQELFEESEIQKTEYEAHYRIVLPDGPIKHLHAIGHPIVNEKGDLVEFVGTVMDVTAAKQAEERIRQSESELRQILELAPQHVYVLGPDPDRTVLYANQAALDYVGLAVEGWRTYDRRRLTHPDDWGRTFSEAQGKLSSGLPHETELRLLRNDGKYRWFLFRWNPIRDDQGRLTRWYVAATDIEDRKQLEQRLQNENVALREEIDKVSMFEQIVGTSAPLQMVLARISKVAPTDSSVLITGETGTGKELVARAIHRRSQRSSQAFVSVNCAAIPRDLIASELFGHEKGAFTGATQRRLGRFELAEGGTIFLDEVGELPAETQIALLRVLQEHEFERVGGAGSMQTNVRVIAATNRDLEAGIAAGVFRSDLFYRLNVFPVEMPPLRERRQDIPMLVEYFIDRYARKAGKSFQTVNKKSLDLLQSYSWPGNIRELQNVIERSVIVCETETFSVDESWLSRRPSATEPKMQFDFSEELAAQEKAMIEAALRETKGRVFGPSGAAAKLGMPGTTLDSKIKSLKISKTRFKTA